MYRDLTKGSITKGLLLFALPMIAGNLLQQFYNIADTLIVGQALGKNALAAVGSAYALMTFLTSIFLGLSMGAGALFSIALGQKDEARLRRAVAHAFGLIVSVTLVLNAAVYAFLDPILRFLQIPAELERFSCMYCGERLTKRQLLTQPEEASCSEEDCAVSFDHAVSRLGWCVQNFRGYQKKILRDAFFEAFETYETGCAPVIQELNSGVRPERQTELLDRAAEAMLDELAAGWTGKNDMEDEKVVLAIFFVPMVRKLQLPVSEEFVSLLQKKWVERYPKSPFYLGDYESISGGFRKKFLGLCFITTAVCQELGKPDDCAELTAFRAFRDGYLAAQPDGEALIREYYNIAPGIVTCINTCSDRHASYERIREQYLTPCYEDLLAGRNADCKTRYVQMVRNLEREYLN